MIRKLADTWALQLSDYLEQPSMKEIYAKGLRTLLFSGSVVGLALLLSIFLGVLPTTLCFLLSFAVFRSFGGGVHLHELLRCSIVSNIIILAPSYAAAHWRGTPGEVYGAFALALLLTGLSLLFWIPAGTDKDPITDPARRRRMWKHTVMAAGLWATAIILLLFLAAYPPALALIYGNAVTMLMASPLGFRVFHWIDLLFDAFGSFTGLKAKND